MPDGAGQASLDVSPTADGATQTDPHPPHLACVASASGRPLRTGRGGASEDLDCGHDRVARDALMTYQLLYSVFIGAALAAMGFLAVTAGLLPGFFRGRGRRRRHPALALAGVFLLSSGIWLMHVMS